MWTSNISYFVFIEDILVDSKVIKIVHEFVIWGKSWGQVSTVFFQNMARALIIFKWLSDQALNWTRRSFEV